MWIGQPIEYDGPHLSDADAIIPLLIHLARLGVDDVMISTDLPVLTLLKGDLVSVTRYTLNGSQVERILKKITGLDNVTAKVGSGTDFDKAITVDDPSSVDESGQTLQYRFRLNITAGYAGAGTGFDATLRRINSVPLTLDQVGFPPALRKRFAITQGSFLIAGKTGSGKTTTFAACLREILEGDTAIKGKILTYESPVEYLFHTIRSAHSYVHQSEILWHLPSFAAAVRNSLRRHPSLVVLGEIRDTTTIETTHEVAASGHPLFGTTHANSSLEIIQRLVLNFPVDQHDRVFAAQVNASKLLMSQARVKGRDGEMKILRDWIYLTNADKQLLLEAGFSRHMSVLRKLMQNKENAFSMKAAADEALDKGEIDERTRLELYRTYGEDENDL